MARSSSRRLSRWSVLVAGVAVVAAFGAGLAIGAGDDGSEQPPRPTEPQRSTTEPQRSTTEPSRDGGVAVPASIDATGSRDVTDPLNDFLAGVPDGSRVVFGEGARYRAEGTIVVRDRRGLTIDGNGATIIADTIGDGVEPTVEEIDHRWPRRRSHIHLRDSSDITVRDLAVRGPHEDASADDGWIGADLEGQAAFDLVDVSGVRIENCHTADTHGDAIYVQGATDVTVTGCEVEGTGRQGMTVVEGTGVAFVDNRLDGIARSAFDLEPNTDEAVVRDIRIADNRVGEVRLNFVSGHGAGADMGQVQIVGNRVPGHFITVSIAAPPEARRSGFLIADNVGGVEFGSPHAPIVLTGLDDVMIRDNRQELTQGRSGEAVEAERSCRVRLEGNEFPNAEPPLLRTDDWAGCDQQTG